MNVKPEAEVEGVIEATRARCSICSREQRHRHDGVDGSRVKMGPRVWGRVCEGRRQGYQKGDPFVVDKTRDKHQLRRLPSRAHARVL